jgi:hypothetical protein
MKRSRFSEEQIIAILKEHEIGVPVSELCRKPGVMHQQSYETSQIGLLILPCGFYDRVRDVVSKHPLVPVI